MAPYTGTRSSGVALPSLFENAPANSRTENDTSGRNDTKGRRRGRPYSNAEYNPNLPPAAFPSLDNPDTHVWRGSNARSIGVEAAHVNVAKLKIPITFQDTDEREEADTSASRGAHSPANLTSQEHHLHAPVVSVETLNLGIDASSKFETANGDFIQVTDPEHKLFENLPAVFHEPDPSRESQLPDNHVPHLERDRDELGSEISGPSFFEMAYFPRSQPRRVYEEAAADTLFNSKPDPRATSAWNVDVFYQRDPAEDPDGFEMDPEMRAVRNLGLEEVHTDHLDLTDELDIESSDEDLIEVNRKKGERAKAVSNMANYITWDDLSPAAQLAIFEGIKDSKMLPPGGLPELLPLNHEELMLVEGYAGMREAQKSWSNGIEEELRAEHLRLIKLGKDSDASRNAKYDKAAKKLAGLEGPNFLVGNLHDKLKGQAYVKSLGVSEDYFGEWISSDICQPWPALRDLRGRENETDPPGSDWPVMPRKNFSLVVSPMSEDRVKNMMNRDGRSKQPRKQFRASQSARVREFPARSSASENVIPGPSDTRMASDARMENPVFGPSDSQKVEAAQKLEQEKLQAQWLQAQKHSKRKRKTPGDNRHSALEPALETQKSLHAIGSGSTSNARTSSQDQGITSRKIRKNSTRNSSARNAITGKFMTPVEEPIVSKSGRRQRSSEAKRTPSRLTALRGGDIAPGKDCDDSIMASIETDDCVDSCASIETDDYLRSIANGELAVLMSDFKSKHFNTSKSVEEQQKAEIGTLHKKVQDIEKKQPPIGKFRQRTVSNASTRFDAEKNLGSDQGEKVSWSPGLAKFRYENRPLPNPYNVYREPVEDARKALRAATSARLEASESQSSRDGGLARMPKMVAFKTRRPSSGATKAGNGDSQEPAVSAASAEPGAWRPANTESAEKHQESVRAVDKTKSYRPDFGGAAAKPDGSIRVEGYTAIGRPKAANQQRRKEASDIPTYAAMEVHGSSSTISQGTDKSKQQAETSSGKQATTADSAKKVWRGKDWRKGIKGALAKDPK